MIDFYIKFIAGLHPCSWESHVLKLSHTYVFTLFQSDSVFNESVILDLKQKLFCYDLQKKTEVIFNDKKNE